MSPRILVTGAAGFIGGYVVQELLEHGFEVIGLDDHSKYGPVAKSYDAHPGYRFVRGDAKDVALLTELAADCDHLLAGAARIGGISYFHEYAYDLLAENERASFSMEAAGMETRETVIATRSGQTIPVSLSGAPITADDPQFQGTIFVVRNITDRKRAERRIRYLARYDALTKVPNRMQFQHMLQQAIARARRNDRGIDGPRIAHEI